MSNYCANCGCQYQDGMIFCSRCGDKIPQNTCDHCHNVLSPDAIFCNLCGQRRSIDNHTAPTTPPQTEVPPTPSATSSIKANETSGQKIKAAIMIGILVAIVFAIFIATLDNSDDTPATNTTSPTSSASQSTTVATPSTAESPTATSTPSSETEAAITPTNDATTLPTDSPQTDYVMQSTSSGYLLPSNTQYLTTFDLYGFTAEEAALARNEIYARYGYNFNSDLYQSYFEAQSWYQSVEGLNASTFSSAVFNDYELENIKIIQAYEATLS